jgi:hypothetical protein
LLVSKRWELTYTVPERILMLMPVVLDWTRRWWLVSVFRTCQRLPDHSVFSLALGRSKRTLQFFPLQDELFLGGRSDCSERGVSAVDIVRPCPLICCSNILLVLTL